MALRAAAGAELCMESVLLLHAEPDLGTRCAAGTGRAGNMVCVGCMENPKNRRMVLHSIHNMDVLRDLSEFIHCPEQLISMNK